MSAAPTRPVLRWHGGKWRLAPWVMAHFPPHRIYVEPFGGAASVLIRKPRAYAEVYNDLDDEVVTLFRVLQDPASAARLIELLHLTPFARTEFRRAYEAADDPVERARRLVVRAFMGFGSNAHSASPVAAKNGFKSQTRPSKSPHPNPPAEVGLSRLRSSSRPTSGTPDVGEAGEGERSCGRSTGFRANSSRSGTAPATDWRNFPDALPAIVDRFRGVVIEQRDALAVMAQHDGADTLHYVDPPYLPETRSPANKYDLKHRMYRHELTRDDHARLLGELDKLEGFVVLSGYPSPLYDAALPHWRRVTTKAHADGARERTEVLWLNPACAAALDRLRSGADAPLFSAVDARAGSSLRSAALGGSAA